MGNYSDLNQTLRSTTNARILILDSNNIQYYYDRQTSLPPSYLFAPYDVILIPGWIYNEYSGSDGKVAYINAIDKPIFIIEESEDYLEMIEYSDENLLELFRVTASFGSAQRFFNQLIHVPAYELPEDWIEQFYNVGFDMRTMPSGHQTRKNAGEVSITVLSFLLLHHFGSYISTIAIASSDYQIREFNLNVLFAVRGTRKKNEILEDLNLETTAPISFQSTDVMLFQAVKDGVIQPDQLSTLRRHTRERSLIYVERLEGDHTTLHEHIVDIRKFIDICNNHTKYIMIF